MRLRELPSVGLRRLIELTPAHARLTELLRFNTASGGDRVRSLLGLPSAERRNRGVVGSAVSNAVAPAEILWRAADSGIPATARSVAATFETEF